MAGERGSSGRRSGSFDAFDLVLRRARLTGSADVAAMPRVADLLAPEGGTSRLTWAITGVVDPVGRAALEIRLDGSVPLECQRCLQPFAWPVEQRTLVLLARNERELATLDAEDDEHEVLLASAPLAVMTLLEDEVLLLLPIAPRCERAACGEAASASRNAAAPRTSAFAALAALKDVAAKKAKD